MKSTIVHASAFLLPTKVSGWDTFVGPADRPDTTADDRFVKDDKARS